MCSSSIWTLSNTAYMSASLILILITQDYTKFDTGKVGKYLYGLTLFCRGTRHSVPEEFLFQGSRQAKSQRMLSIEFRQWMLHTYRVSQSKAKYLSDPYYEGARTTTCICAHSLAQAQGRGKDNQHTAKCFTSTCFLFHDNLNPVVAQSRDAALYYN